MTDTQAPDAVTEADRKTLDEIFIMSLRKAGQERNDDPFLEILARHRISAQSTMQARIEELEAEIRRLNAPADRFSQRMWGNIGGSNE